MAFSRRPSIGSNDGLYINNERVPTIEELYSLKQEGCNHYYSPNNVYTSEWGCQDSVPTITSFIVEPSTGLENKLNSRSSSSNSSNNSVDVNVTTSHQARQVDRNGSDVDSRSLTDPLSAPDDEREQLKHKPLKNKYKCNYCDANFATINLRKQHESKGHTGARLYKCSHCDMYFTTQYRKKVHEIRHGNDCPYTCAECGVAFKSLYKRQMHERAHADQQPYKCQYCGQKFPSPYRKNMHEINHISDMPYECRYCDETFKTQYRCKQHELAHSCDKPYQCQFCHESFKSAHKRYIHILSHSGLANPYLCPKCPSAFRTPYKLRVHLAAVHSLESEQIRALIQSFSQRDAFILASTSRTQEAADGGVENKVSLSPELDYLKMLPDDEIVTCVSCNTMFGNKLHLISHIRTTHTFTFL